MAGLNKKGSNSFTNDEGKGKSIGTEELIFDTLRILKTFSSGEDRVLIFIQKVSARLFILKGGFYEFVQAIHPDRRVTLVWFGLVCFGLVWLY